MTNFKPNANLVLDVKRLYSFLPELILRTPARPFAPTVSEESIQALLGDEKFMESIYLASPALYEECQKWRRGEMTEARKVERLCAALTRYHTRCISRCTPFGLFAGCSVLEWGTTSRIELAPGKNARHTRLDMHYLCALTQHVANRPDVKWKLRYRPNSSLYRIGNEMRYVERLYDHKGCTHQLSALDASEALVHVLELAQQGLTLSELKESMRDGETAENVISVFVEELVREQVLVSELEPTVTGPEFFHHLQTTLDRLKAAVPALAALLQTLTQVQQALHRLDERSSNPASDYERVGALLAPLGVPFKAGKLIQVDALHGLAGSGTATLDKKLQVMLLDAVEVLTYLTPSTPNPRLADFTRRFQARYEDQEVSLLEALDTDSGLPYSDYGKSPYSSLLQGLAFAESLPAKRASALSAAERFLHLKLKQSERAREYSVDITLEELRSHGLRPATQELPPSLAILFRLVDADRVLVESAGGSSAVNLLGRFAHASPGIAHLVDQITWQEQSHNPGVRLAEICHLPASRVGNLLQRPHGRALEIPYLAQSTRPPGQQVRTQDLCLAVRQGRLVLRSRATNDLIVPRLSTAHNFAANVLPVYQLLCDLQTQGLQSQLGVNWGAESVSITFTPRLTCGRVVLAPACWRFDQAALRTLLNTPPANFAAYFDRFCASWQLPRFFTWVEGDNELLVDAQNELLVRVWRDAVRLQPTVLLKEFLFDAAASPVRDATGRPYVSQFLALLVRQGPTYATSPQPKVTPLAEEEVQRAFPLGTEWLYYKLYCGPLLADRILVEVVRPLTAALQAEKLIDAWFFVRYADPDSHLRVRWHLPDPSKVGEVVRLVGEHLGPVSGPLAIWKIQTETYQRELERYGRRSMAATEALFCHQSQVLLERLAQATADGTLADSWFWGLASVDELLTAFDYSLEQKRALLLRLRTTFAQEFGITKELKQQLDLKYRSFRQFIPTALAALEDASRGQPAPLASIVEEINELEKHGQLEVPKDQLLISYVHMLLNRLIPADARLHEAVLYDFLFRHYQSCQARQQRTAILDRP